MWQQQAPLGWDVSDPGPGASAVCFLLSDHARAITGEILHVDGGFHAIGAPDLAVDESAASQDGDGEGAAEPDRAAEGQPEAEGADSP